MGRYYRVTNDDLFKVVEAAAQLRERVDGLESENQLLREQNERLHALLRAQQESRTRGYALKRKP